ncbi:putative HTH-type transcriptional regulator YxaF [Luteitalea pratensis]|uniref:Putative HTH-type transcriptional regulator YxaF n=1 Tax=Luteitalea pratensis TaxID=1855912 RepID=A0A143PHE3_LUTPR|nr:TetR/AcrR family transcriptional regulator [Luteitalea pratensis]AMY07955.1 putative HTH-type transcriptional regulator YxaF [Luteitalea pratensis]
MNSADRLDEGSKPTQSAGPSVADRLLSTASALFYREGIHAVGIQRVIEEAGVAKASLYAHYRSKDDLVAAYLRQRSKEMQTTLEAELARITDPTQRLLHLFDRNVAWVDSGAFRGCPFQNAQSELSCPTHPARAALAEHQAWMRALVTRLVHAAGIDNAELFTGALLALLTGAGARALAEQSAAAAHDARWAAAQLIAAARGPRNTPAPAKAHRPTRSRR